jgi:hypothetical protein
LLSTLSNLRPIMSHMIGLKLDNVDNNLQAKGQ